MPQYSWQANSQSGWRSKYTPEQFKQRNKLLEVELEEFLIVALVVYLLVSDSNKKVDSAEKKSKLKTEEANRAYLKYEKSAMYAAYKRGISDRLSFGKYPIVSSEEALLAVFEYVPNGLRTKSDFVKMLNTAYKSGVSIASQKDFEESKQQSKDMVYDLALSSIVV